MSAEPLTAADFLKFAQGFNSSMENFKTSIGERIHSEICETIAPLHAAQKVITEDLADTKDRVSAIEVDNDTTKTKVEELQKQMVSLQQNLTCRSTPSAITTPFTGPTSVSMPAQPSSLPLRTPSSDALQAILDARRIVGFSPIRQEDIEYLKKQHSITDENQAMASSIFEFLTCEMKVPRSVADQLVLLRVFPPAKPSSEGWSTLYAEFPDISSAELVQQYVRNLLPGKTVSIYVPHTLHPRYSAISDIAHGYRNGDIKHKTRIKYGSSDFVLIVKPKNSNSPWTYISLDILPPLQLSPFDGNTSSPPLGRLRLTSKRDRSQSPSSRSLKARKEDDPDPASQNEKSSSPPSNSNLEIAPNPTPSAPPHDPAGSGQPKTPPRSAVSPPPLPTPRKDPGLFQPSACASPSARQNTNFTFTTAQSSIPKLKTPFH